MLKFFDPDKSYLEGIINSIGDPIFVKDQKHTWVFLNDAFCKFIGHSRVELIGKSDFDFFPTDESHVFWEKDELVFKNEGENINEEKITDAKGDIHIILTKKVLYMDAKGDKYIVGIIRDITERKNTEAQLKARILELEAKNKMS